MTTNMAEVLKLAARPTPYNNGERTWLEVRFKLETYLTLVNEKYVALLEDAASQLVATVPAGTDESSVLIRTLSHTLCTLLAPLTTGRSLSLAQRVPNRSGFEVWRQLVADSAPKTAGQAVLQPEMGENPAKFEETWTTLEHHVGDYEKFAAPRWVVMCKSAWCCARQQPNSETTCW